MKTTNTNWRTEVFKQFYGKICCNGDYCSDGHEDDIIIKIENMLSSYEEELIKNINKLETHSNDWIDGDVILKKDVLSVIENL